MIRYFPGNVLWEHCHNLVSVVFLFYTELAGRESSNYFTAQSNVVAADTGSYGRISDTNCKK